mmetsp:Transcript_106099/g.158733  ORF Transcript_106099/g.158733 Transcript_106099/m.158733 type:complete len:206 (+) Transcript_106099:192-809(+)
MPPWPTEPPSVSTPIPSLIARVTVPRPELILMLRSRSLTMPMPPATGSSSLRTGTPLPTTLGTPCPPASPPRPSARRPSAREVPVTSTCTLPTSAVDFWVGPLSPRTTPLPLLWMVLWCLPLHSPVDPPRTTTRVIPVPTRSAIGWVSTIPSREVAESSWEVMVSRIPPPRRRPTTDAPAPLTPAPMSPVMTPPPTSWTMSTMPA